MDFASKRREMIAPDSRSIDNSIIQIVTNIFPTLAALGQVLFL